MNLDKIDIIFISCISVLLIHGLYRLLLVLIKLDRKLTHLTNFVSQFGDRIESEGLRELESIFN